MTELNYTVIAESPQATVYTIEFVVPNNELDTIQVLEHMLEEARTIGAAKIVRSELMTDSFEEAEQILNNRAITSL